MTESVRAIVLALAEQILECGPEHLVDHAHIDDDIGATSLARLEFLVALERRFHVHFNHDEIATCHRLGEVVSIVERYVAAGQS